jgi:hypothetical protein
MALVSLRQEPDEGAEAYAPNQYGYGTEIRLNGEQCEALGITDMVRAGQPVTLRATGVITRSTEELELSDDSGGKDQSICIQITDLEVRMNGDANAKRAARMLYGEDDD